MVVANSRIVTLFLGPMRLIIADTGIDLFIVSIIIAKGRHQARNTITDLPVLVLELLIPGAAMKLIRRKAERRTERAIVEITKIPVLVVYLLIVIS
ncbi:MAG TPA: hypothetical protein VJP60_07345 [Rhizomicrobium sp.]|nr:hypothetical protein [Rhizomicrobium sp.]